MNDNDLTVRELLTHPQVQGLVNSEDVKRLTHDLDESEASLKDPLYIRVLFGTGAWFSTFFLLIFLAVARVFSDSETAIISGVIFLAAAIYLSKRSQSTFLTQLSLSLAMCGNVSVLIGASELLRTLEFSAVFVAHFIVCVAVYPFYANSIYRFLSPLALSGIAAAWIIAEEAFSFIHLLVAVEVFLAGLLLLHKKPCLFLAPLRYASAVMLPATILFMNLTQVDLWRNNFNEPLWPSSLLLTGSLLFLYWYLTDVSKRRAPWFILTVVSTLLLGVLTTPGVLVAIGLLIIGYAFGDKILTALSYVFIPCFLVLFYYALNIDLAHKSWVIAGSGIVLLVVRWIAGLCLRREVSQ